MKSSLFSWREQAIAWSVMTVMAIGCGDSMPKPEQNATAPTAASSEPIVAGGISEAEAKKFAKELCEDANAGRVGRLNIHFDYDAYLARVFRCELETEDEVKAFVTDFKQSLSNSGGIMGRMTQPMPVTPEFSFLSVKGTAKERRALLRMQSVNMLDYVEVYLERDRTDRIRVVDYYQYLNGQLLSADHRRNVTPDLAEKSAQFRGSLSPAEQLVTQHCDEMNAVIAAGNKQDFAACLKAYDGLPAPLQADRKMLLHRVRMAALSNNRDQFHVAIAAFEKAYPGDRLVHFLAFDGFTRLGDFGEAIDRIEHFAPMVNRDPYLELLQGSVLVAANRYRDAFLAAKATNTSHPDLEEGYRVRAELAAHLGEYHDAATTLRNLCKRFERDLDKETRNTVFRKFQNSTEFASLIKDLR